MRVNLTTLLASLLVVGAATTAEGQTRPRDTGRHVPEAGMVGVGASIGMAPPLEASFKNGPDLTANIETYLTRRVSVRGQVSGAWWDIQGRGFSGTVRPLAFDANAVYNFEGGRTHPFLTAGLGLYHYRFNETPTSGSANKAGVNVGGGVEYFMNRRVTLTGEALYHHTEQPTQSPLALYTNARYWTVTVGLKRYF